jgi:hypothetical protein
MFIQMIGYINGNVYIPTTRDISGYAFGEALKGNLDLNSTIDEKDRQLLRDYILGKGNISEDVDISTRDMDNDGAATSRDNSILTKMLLNSPR